MWRVALLDRCGAVCVCAAGSAAAGTSRGRAAHARAHASGPARNRSRESGSSHVACLCMACRTYVVLFADDGDERDARVVEAWRRVRMVAVVVHAAVGSLVTNGLPPGTANKPIVGYCVTHQYVWFVGTAVARQRCTTWRSGSPESTVGRSVGCALVAWAGFTLEPADSR